MREAVLTCLRRTASVFIPTLEPHQGPPVAATDQAAPSRLRAGWLLAGLGVALLLLGARLYAIQIGSHAYYSERAERLQQRTRPLPYKRGDILSSDGQLLAREIQVPFLMVDPGQLAELVELEKVRYDDIFFVVDCLLRGQPEEQLRLRARILDSARRYQVICDPLDEEQARFVEQLGTPGLHIRYRPERLYPSGGEAAQLLGFTQVVEEGGIRFLVGREGVEKVFDSWLRGEPGSTPYFRDRRGRPVAQPGQYTQPASDGHDLTLTLDSVVQSVVEQALDHLMERSAPSKAQVVLIRPDGRILALGCRPGFEAANREPHGDADGDGNDDLLEAMKLLPLFENFEPGSTLKPILTALFLQNGWVRTDDIFDCNSPYRSPLRRKRVTNFRNRSLGRLDAMNILRLSSNVGMARMIERASPLGLRSGLQAFGFGQRALDVFPHEEVGIFPAASEWTIDYNLPGLSMGYWINVTSLQMMRAYCAIANGGRVPELQLLAGQPERASTRRPVSPDVCAYIREGLRRVVESGTARSVKIDGYAIGGKTGTAEIQAAGGGYTSRNRCSFMGIAPIDNPKLVFACVVENPTRGGRTGGVVAGPVIEEILNQILPYLMAEDAE